MHPGCRPDFQCLFELVIGILVEVGDFDITGGTNHMGIDGWGHNDPSGDFGNLTVFVVAADSQAELGACLSADFGDSTFIGVGGNVDVVDFDNQVAGFDLSIFCRRVGIDLVDLNKAAFTFRSADADANQLACILLLAFGIVGGGVVGGIAVRESGDISDGKIVIQIIFVDGAIVIFADIAVYLRQLIIHRFPLGNVGNSGGKGLAGKNHRNGKGDGCDDEHERKSCAKRDFFIHSKNSYL